MLKHFLSFKGIIGQTDRKTDKQTGGQADQTYQNQLRAGRKKYVRTYVRSGNGATKQAKTDREELLLIFTEACIMIILQENLKSVYLSLSLSHTHTFELR